MNKTYPKEVFFNGEWLPSQAAAVSVFDRGFMLGDGIYEVIPVYGRQPFTMEAHLGRLREGLHAVGIHYTANGLLDRVKEAVERAECADGLVYIQVTRGVAPRTHYFPEGVEPTVLLYAYPFNFEGFEKKLVDVVLSPDLRWHRCDIKSISLMANVLANNAARQAGVVENVFEREGWITEGSHTSVFLVHNGTIYTHPKGQHILPGITRDIVISIARETGIPVREEAFAVADLPRVEEAFLTGTTMQVTAIGGIWINGRKSVVSTDRGPVTRRIQEAFIKQTNSL
ncbi:aminotransferase class IV [Parapedobacter deserti]|uniref:Aminotransferase class IV n=1 Tax=Parapedobacter deserti TaxID=1912957 RepID=A0ABV7JHE8_9SPHI